MRRINNKIPKLHIKKGDTVKVIAGDKAADGSRYVGRVLQTLPSKQMAIVEGYNMVTKHVKPNQKKPQGDRVQREAPVHVSRLQLVEARTGKATRIGRKKTDGGWVRVSKKTGNNID
jgi:large subunit ribosomal protein L24